MKRQQFLETIAEFAMEDYERSQILPSLTIAQAILESNWGQSGLATRANNLFGIKGTYQGKGENFETKEFYSGKWVTITAQFRKYPSFEGSVRDHNDLLNKSRYKAVKGEKEYKKACYAVWAAGYATDPDYPTKLIALIERLKLNEYDERVLYMIKLEDANKLIKILQEEWAKEDADGKKEIARLANEVRKASGQKPQ